MSSEAKEMHKVPALTTLPLEFIHGLSDAAILVGTEGDIITCNQAAEKLPAGIRKLILSDSAPENFAGMMEREILPYRTETAEGVFWIMPIDDGRSRATLTLIDVFLKQLAQENEPHRALGIAIRASLGWNWTAVCRMRNEEEFEVQTWMEGDEIAESSIEKLEGTACGIVLEHGQFIYFKDIAEAFNDDEYLEMGAKIYAGLCYQVNEQPFGHIFALHNNDNVDVGLADAVLSLAAVLLGNQLTMEATREQVNQWKDAASIDAMTNVMNRRALDQDIQKLGKDSLCSLAVIDLDGLKEINDLYGHEAGDRLLVDFSRGLESISRPEDRIYRIGGDEFVLVMEYQHPELSHSLSARLNIVIENMDGPGANDAGASVGVATIYEAGGDFHHALGMADERMYANKRMRKLIRDKKISSLAG